jgi:hypothetical protein
VRQSNGRLNFTSERPRSCAHVLSATRPSWPFRSIVPFSTKSRIGGVGKDQSLYPPSHPSITLDFHPP